MLKFVKHSLFIVAPLLIFMACILPASRSLKEILDRLSAYNLYRPQQKIYLHLDKPLYATGEDIWFSTYLVHATFHTPDSISKIVYVELFNADKKLIQRRALYSPNGTSHGDFHLSDSLPAGNYIIRAYTNYMKNFDEDFFFVKEIAVLAKDDSPPELIDTDTSIDIQFFPEGGNFLDGAENRIAFKAIDHLGKGVAVEGDILDENNALVTSFASEHQGMGFFKFTPFFGKHYQAKIKNRNIALALPEVTQKSYLIRIIETNAAIKVIAFSDLKKYASGSLRIYIVAQSLGMIRFAAEGEILNASLITSIPKSRLPSGITQITLFDGAGIPQCERLVFINHQNTLNISVIPNATGPYAVRQKVELDINVKTNRGEPAQGYFSMSVYDESKIQQKEKYPTSIASHLLLTSDLKGRIEEPGYYFKDTIPTTKAHLDLLMMTHGWRRFTWKSILSDTVPPLEYYAEQGVVISGKVLKTISNRPAKNSDLKIMTSVHDLLILKTDSLGRFYNDNLVYYDSMEFFIQTDNAKGKQTDMNLQLNPFNVAPPLTFSPSPFGIWNAKAFLDQTQTMNQIAKAYKDAKQSTLLKEVVVKAKKDQPENGPAKIYGTADATINMKDFQVGYNDIFQVLQGRVAGLNISGGNPPTVSIRGGGEPLFLLNGMQVDITLISSIPMNDVETIDVLKGASASMYGGRGGNGVIAVYTKRGGFYTGPSVGVHNIKYPGLYKARQFYAPKYDVSQPEQNLPDIRNTLYWNPSIKTDREGNAHVSFYTSDVTSQYKINIEGISRTGIPGAAAKSILIK